MAVKKNILNDVEGFSSRMRGLMAAQKSVNSFAKAAGITEGAIRNYLRGGVKPSQKVLEAIARTANVSTRWLATGEGAQTPEVGELLFGTPDERQMMKLAIQDTEQIAGVLNINITPEQKAELVLAVFDYYSLCSQEGREVAADNIVSFVQEKLKRMAG